MSVYVEEVCKCFKEAYAEANLQTNNEANRQKWYYDRAMNTVQLVPGDVVLLKSDTFQSGHCGFLFVMRMVMRAHPQASLQAGKHLRTCLGVRWHTGGCRFLLLWCRVGRVDGIHAAGGWFIHWFVHGLFLEALTDLLVCFDLLFSLEH